MFNKASLISFLCSLIFASSSLLGELSHDHISELFESDHHDTESHSQCFSCSNDLFEHNLNLPLNAPHVKNDFEVSSLKHFQIEQRQFFLSRAPPR